MTRAIRIGDAGLGRAFTLMLPTFTADPRVRLVAGADPLPAARDQFTRDFGGPAFAAVERLCAPDDVDVVHRALVEDVRPAHDGAWARATLEACLAILASARQHRDIALTLPVATDRR